MPLSKYDRQFGGAGGAEKAFNAMRQQYGKKKGEKVFYATKNRNKNNALRKRRS